MAAEDHGRVGSAGPAGFGAELWKWDVDAYESADGIRLSKNRTGRPYDDDHVLYEATSALLLDVVYAAGGVEAAHKRFVASVAALQASYEKWAASTGLGADEPEPEFGEWYSDISAEDAFYALEEMITWARTLKERLKRPAHDKKRYPDQGLIPALADGARRDAVIRARSRLLTSHLEEVRLLAGFNLHMQSTSPGSPTARVRGKELVIRFPDRVTGPISHRWQLTYGEGRDAPSYADGLMAAVERFMDEMLAAFEQNVPARFQKTV